MILKICVAALIILIIIRFCLDIKRNIVTRIKNIRKKKLPVQTLEIQLFNPLVDLNNGLSATIVIEKCNIPTNTSSFEQTIFRG